MQLETERLILREFTPDDYVAVWSYQRHPLYLRYNPWTERAQDDVKAFVERFIAQQQAVPRTRFQLAVVLKSTGELIGNAGIRRDSIDSHEADIGFELAPKCWGQGYASEAARAVLGLGFTEFRLHRIWAECVPDNSGSIRVLRKLGMQLEGRLRDKEYYKGRWWDKLLFAILEDEWRAQQEVDAWGR
jgi:RimJ/RimL family protein N-acetyltransferase